MTFFYFLPDAQETADDARSFATSWDEACPEWMAEDAAKQEGDDCPDWRPDDWPMTFTILREDHSEVGSFTVHMDYEPIYTSYAKEPA